MPAKEAMLKARLRYKLSRRGYFTSLHKEFAFLALVTPHRVLCFTYTNKASRINCVGTCGPRSTCVRPIIVDFSFYFDRILQNSPDSSRIARFLLKFFNWMGFPPGKRPFHRLKAHFTASKR